MNWNEAFKLMKEGNRIKLPSWAGYWCWNDEKQTIMIHCKDGKTLDIRETGVVDYTFSNIASDEWLLANEENTTILGGESLFGFSETIKYLKRGLKVCRKGWNGKGMWLKMIGNYHVLDMYQDTVHQDNLLPWIGMKTADDKFVPWLASQTDILVDDWMIVE